MKRLRRLAPILGLAVVLSAAGLSAGGCGGEAELPVAELPVTVQADPRVFTLFAGLNMGGYDLETGTAMDPVRLEVREALASADPKLLAPFASLRSQAPPESLALIVIKDIDAPPGFGYKQNIGALPQISAACSALWKAQAEKLNEQFSQAQNDAANALAGPATENIRAMLTYCHEESSPLKAVQVVVNLLASHGFRCSYLDKGTKTGFIIVGPPDADQVALTTHEFAHLYFGPDLFRELELDGKLSRFAPLRDKAKAAVKLINDSYSSLQGFIEDSLVRALVIKVMAPTDVQARLDAEYDAGFVLTPAFYEALGGFETSDKTLIEALPGFLEGIDVGALMQKVEAQPPTGQ